MELQVDTVPSPIGNIVLAARTGALCALDFADCEERMRALLATRFGPVALTSASDPCGYASRVRAYLEGEHDALDEIPVEMGGTSFQRTVWSSLRGIAVGTTISYGELAASIGRPRSARAVGAANAQNPIAVVLPCHRVVGADGSLTGYAGGIERKRWLLRHERAAG